MKDEERGLGQIGSLPPMNCADDPFWPKRWDEPCLRWCSPAGVSQLSCYLHGSPPPRGADTCLEAATVKQRLSAILKQGVCCYTGKIWGV